MAQVEIISTLEPALHDDTEFLNLFKDSICKHGFDNSFDDYEEQSKSKSGAAVLNQMINKPMTFMIEIGDHSKEVNQQFFEYVKNDPIFEISEANDCSLAA